MAIDFYIAWFKSRSEQIYRKKRDCRSANELAEILLFMQ